MHEEVFLAALFSDLFVKVPEVKKREGNALAKIYID